MPTLDVWGPCLWRAIHMVALGYPKNPTTEEKQNYKIFYESLGPVLPCQRCRDNYKRHLDELPIDNYLENADSLFEWTVEMHNLVNLETGKDIWSVAAAKNLYITMPKQRHFTYSTFTPYVIAILIIIVVSLFIGMKNRKL